MEDTAGAGAEGPPVTAWTICVPIKSGPHAKSRLGSVLSAAERVRLIARMAGGVLDAARATHGVGSVVVLSASRPEWWDGDWAAERGAGGLNAHLNAWRAGQAGAPCAIVHGDLPHVTARDIEALLDRASRAGIAMATDHTGKGTNALAIADDRPFAFRFGVGSRARHCAQVPGMAVLQLPGLADDIDEPADLHLIT